jgi:hypothetical protein
MTTGCEGPMLQMPFPPIIIAFRNFSTNVIACMYKERPVFLGPIFRTFFPGKIPRKIPRKIFPPKMLGKIAIFRGKSFEKSFFQQIPRNFPRKITFRGKICTKNWPLVKQGVGPKK